MIMMQMTGTHLLLFKFALKLELFPPQTQYQELFPPQDSISNFFITKIIFFLSCHDIDNG